MSVYKQNGRWRFSFNRVINGSRKRATKALPKGWDAKRAYEYDRQETARLYAIASGQKQDPTIEDAVLLYVKEHCPTLKTGKATMQQLATDLYLYEGRLMSELPEVASEIKKLVGISEATKKNKIAVIRAACRYAYRFHGLGDRDPSERIAMPKVNNERQIYATRLEMLTIYKHCSRLIRPYIRIAFYSGMRMSEILRANVEHNRFVLSDTKNGDPRIVPIHPRILSAAKKYLPPKIAKSTLQNYFRYGRRKAGLDHIKFHDLRHSAASEMINNGIDLYIVGGVLGHKDPRSTKRYSHLATKTLEDAVNRIGRKVHTA